MNEEKKKGGGGNGTFTEVVIGMVLLGVLCFICVERFVAGVYEVVIADWLYAVGIAVVAITIVVGLKWRRREDEKDG